MECNKEEALRAKDLAEKKFMERDFAGAGRLVSKAIRLYPSLEGLSQMLPVIDVHIISQQTVGDGEMDWYGILQIEPIASEATIKSQYKKLALLFHPDKNNAVGAESAFTLISDAWNVLSDKFKRLQHDSKRKSCGVATVKRTCQMSPFPSVLTRRREEFLAQMKAEQEIIRRSHREMEEKVRSVNANIQMRSEHQEKDKKKREREQKKEREMMEKTTAQELKAEREPNKRPRFKIPPKSAGRSTSIFESSHVKENREKISQASELSQLERKRRIFQLQAREARAQRREATVRMVDEDSRHDQDPNVNSTGQHVQENIQADFEQISGALDTEQTANGKNKINEIEGDPTEKQCHGNQPREVESFATNSPRNQKLEEQGDQDNQCPVFIARDVRKPESTFIECSHDIPTLHAAKESLSENLPEVIPEEVVKSVEKVSDDGQIGGLKNSELAYGGQDLDHEKMLSVDNVHGTITQSPITSKDERSSLNAEVVLNDFQIKVKEECVVVSTRMTRSMLREKSKQVFGIENVEQKLPHHNHAQVEVVHKTSYTGDAGLQLLEGVLLEVLPSQFYDFDNMRTRQAFKAGQIWAVYDDKDGMPRFYCRITRVSRSPSPFKAKLCWLEPRASTEEKDPYVLEESNSLVVACGEFEAGEDALTEYINIFSHCIFEQLKEDPVKIYPLKAETWAIYVDWDQKLKGKQAAAAECKDINQTYELVEILEDYSEEQGVVTVRLVQAPGFRCVFQRQEPPDAVQCFLPSQLPAFSHRILSGKVPDDIKLGLSGELWELDPASLPESMLVCSAPQS